MYRTYIAESDLNGAAGVLRLFIVNVQRLTTKRKNGPVLVGRRPVPACPRRIRCPKVLARGLAASQRDETRGRYHVLYRIAAGPVASSDLTLSHDRVMARIFFQHSRLEGP